MRTLFFLVPAAVGVDNESMMNGGKCCCRRLLIAALGFCCAWSRLFAATTVPAAKSATADTEAKDSFARYQIILDRMPFGAEPPPPPPPSQPAAPPAPPPESVFKNIKMCAITRNDITGKVQVGLTDSAAKKNYFLTVGDTEDGIALLAADYEAEKAKLSKDGAELWIAMSDAATATAAVPSAATVQPPARIVPSPKNPVDRVVTMASRGNAPDPNLRRRDTAARTNLTSEVVAQKLQEYQMELIRSGGQKGPPLPMQLTPEMDAQLVKEGVLPPQ